MNIYKILFISIILSFLFLACKSTSNEHINDELDNIESLIKSNPDSAYNILVSVALYPNIDEYSLNRYRLLRIETKDRTFRDISSDTVVFDLHKYFKSRKDYRLTSLAAFYSARVSHEIEHYNQALQYYNEAELYAEYAEDKEMQGITLYMSGNLLIELFSREQAKDKFKKAAEIFKETKNLSYEMISYETLGHYYMIEQKFDSAAIFYEKGGQIAKNKNIPLEDTMIMTGLGISYRDNGSYVKAIEIFKSTLNSQIRDNYYKARINFNIADCFLKMNENDSALYYSNKSLEYANRSRAKATILRKNNYYILSLLMERKNKSKEALEYYKLYTKELQNSTKENEELMVIKADSKYNLELVKNQMTEMTVKNLKTQLILITAFCIVAIFAIIYYRKLLRRNKQLAKANEEILQLIESYEETKELARNNIEQNYNILKKAAELEYFVTETGNKQGRMLVKRMNEVVYLKSEIDWDILYLTINAYHNNFLDKIQAKYPDLDLLDFQLCCLIYSKFSASQISVILGLSINTIHMKTSNLRKKLGVVKYGNIIDFIDEDIPQDIEITDEMP